MMKKTFVHVLAITALVVQCTSINAAPPKCGLPKRLRNFCPSSKMEAPAVYKVKQVSSQLLTPNFYKGNKEGFDRAWAAYKSLISYLKLTPSFTYETAKSINGL